MAAGKEAFRTMTRGIMDFWFATCGHLTEVLKHMHPTEEQWREAIVDKGADPDAAKLKEWNSSQSLAAVGTVSRKADKYMSAVEKFCQDTTIQFIRSWHSRAKEDKGCLAKGHEAKKNARLALSVVSTARKVFAVKVFQGKAFKNKKDRSECITNQKQLIKKADVWDVVGRVAKAQRLALQIADSAIVCSGVSR